MIAQSIKILYVIADSTRSGAPRQLWYLIRELKGQYDIHCACPEGWLAGALRQLGVSVHLINNSQSVWAIRSELRAVYQKVQPALIHCHGVRGGIVGRLALSGSRPKVIYTEHLWTDDYHLTNPIRQFIQISLLQYLDHKTDYTVAVSEAVRRFLIEKKISDPLKTRVIYGGIEAIKDAAWVNRPVIGILGTLTWLKGHRILVRALPKIREFFPQTRCLIAGVGPDKLDIINLAKQLQVDDMIEWFGELEHPERFYTRLRVYVQPSVSESFGMAVLEAMSAGLPVVVSYAGALSEIVQDGKNGLIVAKNNPEELAEAVVKVLSDDELAGGLSQAGIKRAAEFEIPVMARSYVQLYSEAMGYGNNK